jgi:anti-anti-sigma factor
VLIISIWKTVEVNLSNAITIQCENILSIANVKLLHQDLKSAVHNSDEIILNADQVERVDFASLQLFASLFNDSEKNGITVRWDNPSEELKKSIKVVGLEKLFKI